MKNRCCQIIFEFCIFRSVLFNPSVQVLNISLKASWLSPDLFVQTFVTKRSSCSILLCHKLHRTTVLFEASYQAAFKGISLISQKCPLRHQTPPLPIVIAALRGSTPTRSHCQSLSDILLNIDTRKSRDQMFTQEDVVCQVGKDTCEWRAGSQRSFKNLCPGAVFLLYGFTSLLHILTY